MNALIAKPIILNFLKLFLPLALLVLLAAYQIDQYRQKERIERLGLTLMARLAQEKRGLENTLGFHVTDASFMAKLVAQYVQNNQGDQDWDRLAAIMSHFSREKAVYDQVRYLDHEGQELVRINREQGKVRRVPSEQLQAKGHRDYFVKGMALSEGGVHVSPLDLNQEHGKVETPFRPVLRLASPVVPQPGQKSGLVVLNLNAGRLLQMLRELSLVEQAKLYVLDRDGHWLVGPSAEMEWGMALPHRRRHTFAASHPNQWREVRQKSGGYQADGSGLYVHVSLDQLDSLGAKVDSGLTLLAFLDGEKLRLGHPLFSWQEVGVALALLALLSLGWAAAKVRRQMAEREAAQSREKIMIIGESSQDAIAMVDERDRIQFWNPAAERMFGYTSGEMLGGALHRYLAPLHLRDKARTGLEKFARTGQGAVVGKLTELTALRKDGNQVPVELAVASRRLDGQWVAVGSIRDITRRKAAEEKLRQLATTDELTGLSNRRHFLEQCERELGRSRRYDRPLSLVMIDLDHFKKINDTWGHPAGDLVLRELARLCLDYLREVDIMGRVGGEEFAVLLPDTGLDHAVAAMERLRQAVMDFKVDHEGHDLQITISLGVASLRSGEEDITGLMQRADQALYRAKAEGRNRVETDQEGDAPGEETPESK